MNITVTAAPLQQLQVEALVLPVFGDKQAEGLLAEADAALNGLIAKVRQGRAFKGKADQTRTLYPVVGLPAERVVLLGLGDEALTPESWRRAVSAAMNELNGEAATAALVLPAGLEPAVAAEAAAEAARMSLYDFKPFITEPDPDEVKLTELLLVTPDEAAAGPAAARGLALAEVVCWVRDLSNLPGNKLNVEDLIDHALGLTKAHSNITAKVFRGEELAREGFGAIWGVGKGSVHAPAFVALEYRGAAESEAPVVLVGKGITFDTGGICIKPRAGMEEMKTDMHGAATVMGTLRAAAERKLAVNLVGLLPMAENMPSGDAFKPGDILTAYNGMTIEVADTDAEGRLILADALAYGAKHYQPKAMIDLATLTGSIIMAIAYEATGLFTNDDGLAASLKAAGEATGERVWRFPTWDVYDAQTKSDIADVRNAGKEKGDAIHAAMFLKHFAGKNPWVHLDIAGSSWIMEPKPYRPKGSTGVGVRLLIEWLERSKR